MKKDLKIVLGFNSGKEINFLSIKIFFSTLPIVMRPLDKPFDLVTLVVATGGEEVQRTAGLQCAIDLLEVRVFRKAYLRL